MPRGVALTDEEKGRISAFRTCGISMKAIATKIKRSFSVVRNYCILGAKYNTKKRTGRKAIVTNRQKREIFKKAVTQKMTSQKIKTNLGLNVSARHVRRILANNKNAKWTKRMCKPKLTDAHKNARLKFAKKYMGYDNNWHNVVFSDEKKFNLDGPDGFQYYWHDLRREKEVCMSRNFGGGSVMIWGGFSYCGTLPIAWISTRMNAGNYIDLLEISLVEHAERLMGPTFTFQQDNASIHRARTVIQWFEERNIPLLDWPACSPDLNPIENLWGIISRQVYQNGKQYNNVLDLKNAIRDAWTDISSDTLKKLVDSMPDRIFEVIRSGGGHTGY